MIVEGKITRVDSPKDGHHKFNLYLLIDSESGTIGIQVRKAQANRYGSLLQAGEKVLAKIHCEHSAHKSNVNSKIYYHNNLILDEISSR